MEKSKASTLPKQWGVRQHTTWPPTRSQNNTYSRTPSGEECGLYEDIARKHRASDQLKESYHQNPIVYYLSQYHSGIYCIEQDNQVQ